MIKLRQSHILCVFGFSYFVLSWVYFDYEHKNIRRLLIRNFEQYGESTRELTLRVTDLVNDHEQRKLATNVAECAPVMSVVNAESIFPTLDKSLSVRNPEVRDEWISKKAGELYRESGQSVLDVSAGAKPYQSMFTSKGWQYFSNEFSKNENIVDGFRGESIDNKANLKNMHDYIGSDIGNTGAPSNKFDLVILTEVLEHLPEPAKAIPELKRVAKPGGDILITAPFTSGSHQQPYHFSSGYPREWYQYVADKNDLEIIEMTSQGDVFKLLAQEASRGFGCGLDVPVSDHQLMANIRDIVYWYFLMKSNLNSDASASCYSQFTIGWMVHLRKRV